MRTDEVRPGLEQKALLLLSCHCDLGLQVVVRKHHDEYNASGRWEAPSVR